MTPDTPKQAALRLVSRLTDDATFEDIQYQLYVLQKIQAGLDDVAAGRTVPHSEAHAHLSRWLDSPAPSDG